MKALGVFLLIVGILGVIALLNIDIEGEFDIIEKRFVPLILSAIIALLGFIIVILKGKRKPKKID